VGSHDLILDIIADMMAAGIIPAGQNRNKEIAYLSGSHVGSMAGLLSLNRKECHIAPIHLLDEEAGTYNDTWAKKLVPGKDLRLIKGVGRIQGLIVPKGNPLDIHSINDLRRCRYVNRQRGAGTRIFLDYQLKKAGLDPNSIEGYDREAATHMAVAALVQNGNADTGMGIASAAKALGLGFIPLGEEEYDFATFQEFLELSKMKIFLDILKSPDFHKKLEEMGGYMWKRAGEIVPL
jgi:putative molybdopterin biosynthesis protein